MVGCPSDADLLVFVEGGHDDRARTRIERHLDTCWECREAVAEAVRSSADGVSAETATELGREPPSLPVPGPGSALGRYVVIDELGRGGVGLVVRAYDPKLQREVALKLVRTDRMSAEAEARVVREARAMAQLNHPHVVRVYDVELDAARVLLSMELVEGGSLADWLRSGRRDPHVVLEHFIAAGRGLAAAHAAGVLHRDFKPANVLVDLDGPRPRVLVTDFGLARMDHTSTAADTSITPASTPGDGDGDGLTETGTVMGTLLYMAPEQHRGAVVSPAADQFAFCVALWEGLTGRRPYVGLSSSTLCEAKLAGPPPWPREVDVPRKVIDALRRGLAPPPADRFPRMDALLHALSESPRRWWTPVAAALAVVGVAGAAWWLAADRSRCDEATTGTLSAWGEPRRAQVRSAIERTQVSYGDVVWRETERSLDQWTADWAHARQQVCEASAATGPSGADATTAQRACLHHARRELEVTTELLAQADANLVDHTPDVVAALPDPMDCVDPQRSFVDDSDTPPADAARVEHVRDALAGVRALRRADALDVAAARMDALRADTAVPTDAAVQIEIDLENGRLASAREDDEAAAQHLEAALTRALEAGRWDVAAQAALELARVRGLSLGEPARGRVYLGLARGVLARLSNARTQASLHETQAQLDLQRGDPAAAAAQQRQAVQLYTRAVGADGALTLDARAKLAGMLIAAGELDAARTERRAVLAWRVEHRGDAHPDTVRVRKELSRDDGHDG